MMSCIPDALKTDATRLLKFLVHAERPLTLVETIDVIATGAEADETPTFDIEGRLHHHHDILQYCPGLISIIDVPTEDYDGEDWEESTEVHLAHFSVKEYLLMQNQFSIASGGMCIARTCLAYRADVNRTITSSSQFVKHDIFAKFYLQDYATQYWMRHAASSETSGQLVEEAMRFPMTRQSSRYGVGFLTWDIATEPLSPMPVSTDVPRLRSDSWMREPISTIRAEFMVTLSKLPL
jgi:hypothetical protein